MNIKKRIIILILFIILFSGYFLIKNDADNIFNNTADVSINSNISKNISSNTINSSNESDNSSNINDNLSTKDSLPKKQENYRNEKKSKGKSDEITEEEILEYVKNSVVWDDGKGGSTQNVKLGKPYKYKDLWLVPAFDKKTGKFLGAVWVASEGAFFGGVDSYSEYKDIISGKSIHESKSNKNDVGGKSAPVEDEIPDFSERYVLATPNPNAFNSHDILITDQGDMNLDNDVFLDSDQLMPVIESDCELNSSS